MADLSMPLTDRTAINRGRASSRDRNSFRGERRPVTPGTQRGITLVVSLIFLLLLTIIGVTSMNTGIMQQRMTTNMRDSGIAFQTAESALRFAESAAPTLITNCQSPAPSPTGANGLWATNVPVVNLDNVGWWTANGIDTMQPITEAYQSPHYVVEFLQYDSNDTSIQSSQYNQQSGTGFYRITTRGTGATNNAHAILQETYQVRC